MSLQRYKTWINGIATWARAINSSSGVADANKIISSNAAGFVDHTLLPSSIKALWNLTQAVTLTGVTTETEIANFTIPGGTLGPNGTLLYYHLFSATGSTNIKTVRFRAGSGGPILSSSSGTVASFQSFPKLMTLTNRNSEAVQVGPASSSNGIANASSGVASTFTVNTANDVTISITGQLALASEFIRLESGFALVLK